MSRIFRAIACVLLLGSCAGSGNFSAPRNLDDACSIVSERPEYLRAFRAAERKYGVPVPSMMAIIYQESKFIGNNRPPHRFALGVIPVGRQSSALGYSQALDGTWEEYQRDQRRFGARRDRMSDASDFMGWYMDQSSQKLGISKADAQSQYLAYHEGRTGFANQTYRNKPWLMDVASAIGQRSQTYANQLAMCRR